MKEYSYGIAPYRIIDDEIYVLVAQAHKNGLYGFNGTLVGIAVSVFAQLSLCCACTIPSTTTNTTNEAAELSEE
jgi:urea transporter